MLLPLSHVELVYKTFLFSRDMIAPPLILDIIITPKLSFVPYTLLATKYHSAQ